MGAGSFLASINRAERGRREQVIAATGLERDFAVGDAAGGGGAEGLVALDGPARGDEGWADFFAGGGFRVYRRTVGSSGNDAERTGRMG